MSQQQEAMVLIHHIVQCGRQAGLGLFLTRQEENSDPLHDIKSFPTRLYTKAFISESQ